MTGPKSTTIHIVQTYKKERNEQKILEELSHLFKDDLDLLADFRSISTCSPTSAASCGVK